ncbi:amidohydrolase family protein [uncultured Croceitalea sp.]|uniref:amidohydrolase family protein n=1 Tax=uncultured Croceitalea sp. TaxID=1798908 RepID=UPI0033062D04
MKKTIRQRILKWIKYTFLITITVILIGILLIYLEGKSIYGGETEIVDYQQFQPKTGTFVIQDVNVLSVNGDSIIPNRTVLIKNGHITAIDSILKPSNSATIIDGSDKYLIPGLIDAHAHLLESPNDLLLYIANGVTQIRELIGQEDHLQWRDEIKKGRIGPKLFVASPRLGTFSSTEGRFMEYSQWYKNIQTPKDARKLVSKFNEAGYDGIKIYSQLTKENYMAVTETAKSLDMPVFGHIPWDITLEDIYSNGQSEIAHFEELANALRREFKEKNNLSTTFGREHEFLEYLKIRVDEVAKNLKKNNITVTSTLWLAQSFETQKFELDAILNQVELQYQNPGISEWSKHIPGGIGWLPEVNRYKITEELNEEELILERNYWYTYGLACEIVGRSLHKNGVSIMVGTDANLPPVVPGFSLHDEMISLQKIGMTNAEILKSATSVPASWLNDNSGKIKIGYEANLLLLNENPLENINNTKHINTVILKGSVLDRTLLNNLLKAVKEANDKSRTINISNYR